LIHIAPTTKPTIKAQSTPKPAPVPVVEEIPLTQENQTPADTLSVQPEAIDDDSIYTPTDAEEVPFIEDNSSLQPTTDQQPLSQESVTTPILTIEGTESTLETQQQNIETTTEHAVSDTSTTIIDEFTPTHSDTINTTQDIQTQIEDLTPVPDEFKLTPDTVDSLEIDTLDEKVNESDKRPYDESKDAIDPRDSFFDNTPGF